MFQSRFFEKNIKKFFLNFKKKKFFLNTLLFKCLFKKKKNIDLKIIKFKINKYLTNKSKFKKNIIIFIYENYLKKINKNFKILILKNPNIVHKIILKKNIIIKIKKYRQKKIFNLKKKKIFFFKISNILSGKGYNFLVPPLSIFYEKLKNYIINLHIFKNNYKYLIVPNIINFKFFVGCGQIPKFIKKLFILKINKKIKYLIPTSEISLVSFIFKKKINSNFIPIKFFSYTECYRNEKICYGLKNKWIIKKKQFDKIELVKFVDNKNSNKYLIELIKNVETLIKKFKINYRILKLSNNELSYISKITFDLEIWIPEINNYCEVSSCSNIGTYQSIRLNIKYKKNKNEYINIINGSGLAIGRFFLSIISNNKIREDIFDIPNILKKKIKKEFIKL